jgi:drug/metabolite transporter (DMT)-like permease
MNGDSSCRPYLYMLGGSLLFAGMGVLAHAAGETISWQMVALARCSLAFVFSLGLALATGVRLVAFGPRVLWVRSLAGSVSMVCSFYALTHMPVSDVLTITNTFPIWVALLSWPLEGRAPAPSVWLAIVCGLAGVVLIQQPHLADGNWAALIALVSSLFTALAMLGLHNIKGVDVRAIVVHFSGVATVFAALAWIIFDRSSLPSPATPLVPLALLLGVGVLATGGQLFLTQAFTLGEPTRVSVVGLTQVAFAMVLDTAFLGYSFGPLRLLGIALVVAPTAWVILRQPALSMEIEPKVVDGSLRETKRIEPRATKADRALPCVSPAASAVQQVCRRR